MSIQQAIEAEAKLRELVNWRALGRTIADYDQTCHTLRMDLCVSNTFAYCGQQYAGSKNYHDAPKWFTDEVLAELKKDVEAAVERAYQRVTAGLRDKVSSELDATQKLVEETGR